MDIQPPSPLSSRSHLSLSSDISLRSSLDDLPLRASSVPPRSVTPLPTPINPNRVSHLPSEPQSPIHSSELSEPSSPSSVDTQILDDNNPDAPPLDGPPASPALPSRRLVRTDRTSAIFNRYGFNPPPQLFSRTESKRS